MRPRLENIFAQSGFHCLLRILDAGPVPHHEAVAGFSSPSFEGERKIGKEDGRLLDF
jgi:hypothetical protein